jgi:hypothetical protein
MSSDLDEDTIDQVRGLINDYGLALEASAEAVVGKRSV